MRTRDAYEYSSRVLVLDPKISIRVLDFKYQLTVTSVAGLYFGNILPSAVNFIIFIIVKLVPFRVPDTGSSNAFRSFGQLVATRFFPSENR